MAALAMAISAAPGFAQDASPSPDANGDQGSTTSDPGPLIGNWANIVQEESCIADYAADASNNYVNYWPSIGSPEHTDAIHSGTQPCAIFTGDYSGSNIVLQHTSDTTFLQNGLIVFDGPGAGYLLGGYISAPSTGQFVAKFDPGSGQEIWRTQFQNLVESGDWLALASMAIHENGYIYIAAGPTVTKIDRDTGEIVAQVRQPIQDGGAENANFDGMHFAPDKEGTILLKSQNRSPGCPTQGNGAMGSCQDEYGPQPATTVVAVDPDTLDNIASIALPQQVTARPVVTTHNGRIYIYMAGISTLQRVQWEPKKGQLVYDDSWAPEYLLDGQTTGSAPAVLGDWIITNQNAQGGTTPQCAVAVSQDDPTNLQRLCPWGDTLPDGAVTSQTLGSFGVDPDNSLIFMQDPFVGGVFAVSLDQSTGALETAWSRPDWRTSDYFTMTGPADQRVVSSQYWSPDWSTDQMQGFAYTEAVEWANALTGETIARSDYTSATAMGSLVNVGYGGRFYTMANSGSIFIFEVQPAPASDGS